MKRRKENLRGRSGADSKQSGGKFAKLGLRWGMFADLAQKKVEESTFGGSFGATLGVRWGKGADLVPKKLEKSIFEPSCTGSAARDRTWGPILGPSWRQEVVKTAKLGPRWRQVGAKSGQKERRGGLRSDLGTKSWILKLVVFRWEYVYFADIGRLSGGKLGIQIGKMK